MSTSVRIIVQKPELGSTVRRFTVRSLRLGFPLQISHVVCEANETRQVLRQVLEKHSATYAILSAEQTFE